MKPEHEPKIFKHVNMAGEEVKGPSSNIKCECGTTIITAEGNFFCDTCSNHFYMNIDGTVAHIIGATDEDAEDMVYVP